MSLFILFQYSIFNIIQRVTHLVLVLCQALNMFSVCRILIYLEIICDIYTIHRYKILRCYIYILPARERRLLLEAGL